MRLRRLTVLILCICIPVLSGCGTTGGSTQKTASSQASSLYSGATVPESTAVPAPVTSAMQRETASDNPSSKAYATITSPSDSGGVETGIPALKVEGNMLCNENGEPVQLRGISTHGLAWFPQYVNEACVSELKSWGANVLRLAMYTAESGGYCTGGDKQQLKNLVREGIKYATSNGMYVIVDWHVLSEGDPNVHKEEAKAFFDEISKEYSGYSNVIYEICNEPCNGATWDQVSAYANEVIPVIRSNAPKSVIIVGTPNWSQDVDKAAEKPLQFENVMYTLHFYAATHKDDLRAKMEKAINAGLPVFVSEFGICDASGNGAIDEGSADTWIKMLNKLNISYICWNLSNKAESSAIISSACNKTSGFTDSDLSQEGKWIRNVLASE